MTESLNRHRYEKAAIDISDEEIDVLIPKRKPIGWNYQNAMNPTTEQTNGEHVPVSLCSKAASLFSRHSSTDDVEVLEVLEMPTNRRRRRPLFPPSSTKQEIKSIIRNVSQSSIDRFFPVESLKSKDGGQLSQVPSTSGQSRLALPKLLKKQSAAQDAKATHAKSNGLHADDSEKDVPLDKEADVSVEENESENRVKEDENRVKEEVNRVKEEVGISSECSQSTLQKFIERWRSLKPFTKDEVKIKDKIWKNYYACHTSYTHSRRFINDLQNATENLIKIENIYVYIAKLKDCLKRYKDTPYMEKYVSEQIKKLEESEVDLDDDVNSSYLVLDRLKSSFVKLDELYCKLCDCSTSTGRPTEKKFRYQGSRYPEINKRITAWVNKNRCFPEYMDVLNLVKNVTKNNSLPLRPESIRVQAQEIFRDVGKILKERRERDDLFSIYAYAKSDEASLSLDPAHDNEDLSQKLNDNEKSAREKLNKVFQYYVDKEGETRDKKEKVGEDGESAEDKEETTTKEDEETEGKGGSEQGNGRKDSETETKEEEESEIEELVESSLDEDDDDEISLPDLLRAEKENEPNEGDEGAGEGGSVSFKASEAELFTNSDTGNCLDDSDDDEIQEILNAPAKVEEEEEDEEQDEEQDEEIKEENYLTDEDVEVALSPSLSFTNEFGIDVEEDELDEYPISQVTCFKRKREHDEYTFFNKKTQSKSVVPEIVEID